jgi:DNA-binding transcriptional ArsR family regulator
MTAREKAASELLAVLDSEFLRALTEPARLELLRVMLVHGPADIGTLASHLPQDRSVISRHLITLERAGIVSATRAGRRHIYALDGSAFVRALEEILGTTRRLADICCPPAKKAR